MRTEKQIITQAYVQRLNASPFFIVVDYTGLRVGAFMELRKRLRGAGAEMHVIKNSIFRVAAREAGIGDLGGSLGGMLAVVSGPRDISAAAKVLQTFHAEFDRPMVRFGYLDNERLDVSTIQTLASLPPLGVLRGQLLGLLNMPATQLVRLLNTPATQMARVLKAKAEKAT